MELKDLLALYVSGFAALIALLTLAYQWWRDYLSTLPVVRVMTSLRDDTLDIALYNKRNPTVIVEIGMCTLSRSGKITDSEILSRTFQVLGDGESLILKDVLNTGVSRILPPEAKYKIFVEVTGGKKFYSPVFEV